MDDGLNE
jgi:signal transduction histidine kinase